MTKSLIQVSMVVTALALAFVFGLASPEKVTPEPIAQSGQAREPQTELAAALASPSESDDVSVEPQPLGQKPHTIEPLSVQPGPAVAEAAGCTPTPAPVPKRLEGENPPARKQGPSAGGCKTAKAIEFIGGDPLTALGEAAKARKLVLILHVSGHFEDSSFTWNNAEALRANALNNEEVAAYLSEHFVCMHEKAGSFVIKNGQKKGGNVASYFCLYDGRVLSAIAGPVDAKTFLREARWAVSLRDKVESEDDSLKCEAIVAQAHKDRLDKSARAADTKTGGDQLLREEIADLASSLKRAGLKNEDAIHVLLARYPLVSVYSLCYAVFEKLLGEKITNAPVQVLGKTP